MKAALPSSMVLPRLWFALSLGGAHAFRFLFPSISNVGNETPTVQENFSSPDAEKIVVSNVTASNVMAADSADTIPANNSSPYAEKIAVSNATASNVMAADSADTIPANNSSPDAEKIVVSNVTASNVMAADTTDTNPAPFSAVYDGTIIVSHVPAAGVAAANATDRLLVFWCVRSGPLAMHLVKESIDHLRIFPTVAVDVFLVHYDNHQDRWVETFGSEWYWQNVQFNTVNYGLKMWSVKDILLGPQFEKRLDSYQFIWVPDEDAGIRTVNVERMLHYAHMSGAQIVTPAFFTSTPANHTLDGDPQVYVKETASTVTEAEVRCQAGDSTCEFQTPHPECAYRYTNFVEVSFPLFTPTSLRQIIGQCSGCMSNRSTVWGLDKVWCGVAGNLSNSTNRSCAILDATPIRHMNLRTLPKWKPGEWRLKTINWNTVNRVKHAFPEFFVNETQTHECVTE